MTIKGILIDFDGTLVDSVPALWECYKTFLETEGIVASHAGFFLLNGPSIFEIVTELKTRYEIKEDVEVLAKRYRDLVAEAYAKKVQAFPHAVLQVRRLKDKNFKLAIVTAAPLEMVQDLLKRYELTPFFDYIIAREKGEPSKPHPALYQRALKVMGIPPEEAIAIEDSPNGFDSARAAGIKVVDHWDFFDEILCK